MTIYTIGFTKKSARSFFTKLQLSGAKRLVDVRLNNVSQLAGFAKRDDLQFFLESLCQMQYIHIPALAPTQDMLDAYKKKKGDWTIYEAKFLSLMEQRRIETTVSEAQMAEACLLCSEDTPEHCHRRLVAEYLRNKWHGVEIRHIV